MGKKESKELQVTYQSICSADLMLFETLILPSVYEELPKDTEPIEEGYLCIGALVDEQPVAAVVVYLEPYGDLDLRSLFVLTQYRRRGIASALTNRVVQVAVAAFPFEEPEEVISFKMMYALPPHLKAPWEAFLRADGFYIPDAVGKTYELDSRDLARSVLFSQAFDPEFVPQKRMVCVEQLQQDQREQLMERAMRSGVFFSPEYSYVHLMCMADTETGEQMAAGDAAYDVCVLIDEETPGYYRLECADAPEQISQRVWLGTLQAALGRMAQSGVPFLLAVSDSAVGSSQIWEQAAGEYSRCYEQCVAWQEITGTFLLSQPSPIATRSALCHEDF